MATFAASDVSSIPVYSYKRYDPSNNIIQCEENPSLPIFTTTTTKGFMDIPKHTLIICEAGGDKSVKVQGEIDWKNKRIAVEVMSKTLSEAKHKLGGAFSLDTEWTWSSGKYMITHKSGIWMVKRDGRELAVYTSLKVKAFSKAELATLKFLVEIPNEEKVFLMLILMFHDFQLPPVDEPKTFKEAAAEEGGKLAVTVTGNAIASCCVIQ